MSNEEAKRQARALQRASRQAQKESEDQGLTVPENEPRSAKKRALANPAWLAAEGKKRRTASDADVTSALPGPKESVQPKKHKKKNEDEETVSKPGRKKKGADKAAVPTPVTNVDNVRRVQKAASSQKTGPHNSGTTSDWDAEGESESNSEGPALAQRRSTTQRKPQADRESDQSSELSDQDGFKPDSEEDESEDGLEELAEDELDGVLANETFRVVSYAKATRAASAPPSPLSRRTGGSSLEEHSSPSSGNTSFQSFTSSTASRPPSSDSEAPRVSLKSQKKGRKVSAKREEAFKNEFPAITRPVNSSANEIQPKSKPRRKTIGSDSESESDRIATISAAKWPSHARLVGTGLNHQNAYIQLLTREAIAIVEKTVLIGEAWPELNRTAEYRMEVLMEALGVLRPQANAIYTDIRSRIKADKDFMKVIGKWVMDCLPHTRGPARAKGLDQIAMFQLGVGEGCTARVKALILHDMYIYPGEWGHDDEEKPIWVAKTKEIYLNEGLINVLRSAFFATPTAPGHKFKESYVSSHSTRREPEFPPTLVALAATGLYAGLHAWRSGKKAENEKFEGDIFKPVFDRHISYLTSIKSQNGVAYHVMMSTLYSKVMNGKTEKEDVAAHTREVFPDEERLKVLEPKKKRGVKVVNKEPLYSSLSPEAKQEFEAKARSAVNKFLMYGDDSDLSHSFRRAAREHQSFLPEAATASRALAKLIHHNSFLNYQCRYHEKTKNADHYDGEKNTAGMTLHGAAYEMNLNISSNNIVKPLPGFFHCGCSEDDVLLDFFFWKTWNISSKNPKFKGVTESMMSASLTPRMRAFVCQSFLATSHLTLDNLYGYDYGSQSYHLRILVLQTSATMRALQAQNPPGDVVRELPGLTFNPVEAATKPTALMKFSVRMDESGNDSSDSSDDEYN